MSGVSPHTSIKGKPHQLHPTQQLPPKNFVKPSGPSSFCFQEMYQTSISQCNPDHSKPKFYDPNDYPKPANR